MRLRQRRRIGAGRTGVNRKAIGAAVIAGVLVAGGVTGLQLASAGEQAQASEIVVVDGQNFDIAGCEKLEINAGTVVCDGELEPAVDHQLDLAPGGSGVACHIRHGFRRDAVGGDLDRCRERRHRIGAGDLDGEVAGQRGSPLADCGE